MYYHLGAYDEALQYALGAAYLLNLNEISEYTDTVVGKKGVRGLEVAAVPRGLEVRKG